MERHAARLLLFVFLAGIPGWTGCVSNKPTVLGLFARKKTDFVPGIVPPAERIDMLRKLGQKAAWAEPAERETISADLAAAYQGEEDPLIRAELVHAIGGYRTRSAASVLELAMGDSDSDVRLAACEALGKSRNPEAIGMLAAALSSDMDVDVRMAAAKALGETGDSASVEPLGRLLEERDPALQHQAVASLRKCSGEDLGNDVNRWRQYVHGETPDPPRSISVAERIKRFF
jgi:HEAT repeat protein